MTELRPPPPKPPAPRPQPPASPRANPKSNFLSVSLGSKKPSYLWQRPGDRPVRRASWLSALNLQHRT